MNEEETKPAEEVEAPEETTEEETFNPSEPGADELGPDPVDTPVEEPTVDPVEEPTVEPAVSEPETSLNTTETIDTPKKSNRPAPQEKEPQASFIDNNTVKVHNAGGLSLSDRAAATKAKLEKEPKINTVVSLEPGEKPGSYKIVNINGFRLSIRKNTPIELPKTVWELIMRNQKSSVESSLNHPRNLNNAAADTRAALSV